MIQNIASYTRTEKNKCRNGAYILKYLFIVYISATAALRYCDFHSNGFLGVVVNRFTLRFVSSLV